MYPRRVKLVLLLAYLVFDFVDPSLGVFSFESDSAMALGNPLTQVMQTQQTPPAQGTDESQTTGSYRTQRPTPALRHARREPERRDHSRSSEPPPSSPDAH
jgi:hypothetical protein